MTVTLNRPVQFHPCPPWCTENSEGLLPVHNFHGSEPELGHVENTVDHYGEGAGEKHFTVCLQRLDTDADDAGSTVVRLDVGVRAFAAMTPTETYNLACELVHHAVLAQGGSRAEADLAFYDIAAAFSRALNSAAQCGAEPGDDLDEYRRWRATQNTTTGKDAG